MKLNLFFKLYLTLLHLFCSKQTKRRLAGKHLAINSNRINCTDQDFTIQYAALLAKHYKVEPEHVLAQSWRWVAHQNLKVILNAKKPANKKINKGQAVYFDDIDYGC